MSDFIYTFDGMSGRLPDLEGRHHDGPPLLNGWGRLHMADVVFGDGSDAVWMNNDDLVASKSCR
jgi:hypothetical protein